MAPDFRRQRSGERDDTSRPVLITGARESYQDELAARKKRYFLLMSVRIPALFLAAGSLALWNNPWIALAIVAGSIPIPWIAVIGANDRPPLPKGQARTYTAGSLPSSAPYSLPSSLTGSTNGGRPGSGGAYGRAIGPATPAPPTDPRPEAPETDAPTRDPAAHHPDAADRDASDDAADPPVVEPTTDPTTDLTTDESDPDK